MQGDVALMVISSYKEASTVIGTYWEHNKFMDKGVEQKPQSVFNWWD